MRSKEKFQGAAGYKVSNMRIVGGILGSVAVGYKLGPFKSP